MGSAMALRFRANLQKNETVLINGATGVTGKIAVQIAKHYGAKKLLSPAEMRKTKRIISLGG